jgi:hypothetical protein
MAYVEKRCHNFRRQRAVGAVIVAISAAALMLGTHARAQSRLQFRVTVPESTRYIFDIPWCTKWLFLCGACEKVNNQVVCNFDPQDCSESFRVFQCEDFNAPAACQIWSDGCNIYSRQPDGISRTAMKCQPYVPAFTCMKER